MPEMGLSDICFDLLVLNPGLFYYRVQPQKWRRVELKRKFKFYRDKRQQEG